MNDNTEGSIKLRPLKPEDAPLMLEWMHDPSVVENMQTDFSQKTLDDCLRFIAAAQESRENIHMAVALETDDIYLGTVSLKHIQDGTAEFAITIRKCAMGGGYAIQAMQKILEYGIKGLGLQTIYWYVRPENKRAVRFYNKNGFRLTPAPDAPGCSPEDGGNYLWYEYTKEDENRKVGE